MTVFFADTSALCKRYIIEAGSQWVRAQLDPTTGSVAVIVHITAVELISAISRRERAGSLSQADATLLRSSFRTDFASKYQVVEVDNPLVNHAMRLAETHGLRGYDAIQLAACLYANQSLVARGQPGLTLLSADEELNVGAKAEGINVENPNLHP